MNIFCYLPTQYNPEVSVQMLEIPGTSEEASLKGAYVLEGMVGSSTTIPSPKVTKYVKGGSNFIHLKNTILTSCMFITVGWRSVFITRSRDH